MSELSTESVNDKQKIKELEEENARLRIAVRNLNDKLTLTEDFIE